MKALLKKIVPQFVISWYHFGLVFLGAVIYRFPGKKLKIIGVTGTNGKSTVVEMISRILEESGIKTASQSSVRFRVAGKEWENKFKMTMPGRFFIQKFLRQAVDTNCKYVVLEVTSEGIKQYRHKFIDFDLAVFTNLAPEHIESHGGFENYKKAKTKLFKIAKKIHIINLDDESAHHFLKTKSKEKFGFSILGKKKKGVFNVFAENIKILSPGLQFSVRKEDFYLPLTGKFNVQNALAAICVGLALGISLEGCKSALGKIKAIPGRMEEIISNPFKIVIDYAFTPNALEKVYQSLKPEIKNKMICVLGAAGGGRDKWKRPVLGQIAGIYCDKIIVTNEDPYDEDPMEIINQVSKGAEQRVAKILDRREAIKTALIFAKPNDVVVVTGKGCEPWLCVSKGKKIPWDDRKIVKEEFEKLKTDKFKNE
ncbi:Mur ligase family protein [Patescibacteria group bacterium]